MSCFKRIVCQCVMVNPPLFFAFTSCSALWSVSERKDSPAFIVSFCLSISLKRETIFSLSNVYVYTCARINIKVCFNTLFPSFQKSFLPTSLRISVLQKSQKKPCMKVWWICFKALILHPLSREKGDTVDMLRREKVMNDRLMKTFWNFFFKKFWWFKNLPYLCIRFPKESLKRRVLWKI